MDWRFSSGTQIKKDTRLYPCSRIDPIRRTDNKILLQFDKPFHILVDFQRTPPFT